MNALVTLEENNLILAQALQDCARALNSTLNYEEVLDQIIAFASRIILFDAANILLVQGQYVVIERAVGYSDNDNLTWNIPIAETPNFIMMMQSKRPCIISDTYNDPGWIVTPEHKRIRSYAGAPIVIKNNVVGFLNFESITPNFYSPELADALQAFADQAALAIRNARMYEEAQAELAERRRMEATLRDSELRLQAVINTASDAIITIDSAGLIMMVNSATEIMFGYSRNALIGRHLSILLPERFHDNHTHRIAEFDQSNVPSRSMTPDQVRYGRRANGDEFPIRSAISQFISEGQKMFTAIVRDVTEQFIAEQSTQQHLNHLSLINHISYEIGAVLDLNLILRQTAVLVQTLFNYHHVAIFLVDGPVLRLKAVAGSYVNLFPPDHTQPKNAGIIGWVATQGKTLVVNDVSQEPLYVNLTQGDTQAKSELGIPIIQASRPIGVIDIQSPHLNGFSQSDVVAIETLARQIAVAMNTAWLYEQARQEILERQQVESTLRESEARFKLVSELTSDYAYAGRLTADRQLQFEWITDAISRISGFTAEELQHGDFMNILIHPDDLPDLVQRFTAVMAGEPQIVQFRMITKQGDIRWLSDHIRPVWDASHTQVTGFIGAAQDVTEQRQIEEAMQRAQKLESLGILSSGIAHDFNNLLMAIMSHTTLASLKLNQSPEARKHLDHTLQATERGALLTRQLLAYSGKGHVDSQSINLNRLIEENVAILQAALPKNVTLHMGLLPDLPNVLVDAGQIQQVVMNLIVNAAEAYEGQPGEVLVTTKTRMVAEPELGVLAHTHQANLTAGMYVHIDVSDSGKGMSPETQARVFDPFFTTKFTGRGLGLAAVLGIVHNHKGWIEIDSMLGKGTTFHIYLPATTEKETATKPVELTTTAVHSGVVLVVDDEPVVCSALLEILKLSGFTTISADNGQTGVDKFAQHSQEIDLVVMDMTMPVLSGEAAYHKMQEIRPHTPVLFLSGYEEVESFRAETKSELVRFLHKPFDLQTLMLEVQSLLGNRQNNQAEVVHEPPV